MLVKLEIRPEISALSPDSSDMYAPFQYCFGKFVQCSRAHNSTAIDH